MNMLLSGGALQGSPAQGCTNMQQQCRDVKGAAGQALLAQQQQQQQPVPRALPPGPAVLVCHQSAISLAPGLLELFPHRVF